MIVCNMIKVEEVLVEAPNTHMNHVALFILIKI